MADEHSAKARGLDLPISFKMAIEMGRYLAGRKTKQAKRILENVMKKKQAIPLNRYTKDRGHKPGMSAGRYPMKASQYILALLESAEANAQNKGLDAENLIIKNFISNKGTTQWRSGRKRRRQMKRTHVDVVVEESEKQNVTPKVAHKNLGAGKTIKK
ncbi:50S ribosomal protein L22 [Candidatus Woesearchaeota archaeon]|nr:50S ribosomal protein L22 [Candidatus Woesearchaeota archaeon]